MKNYEYLYTVYKDYQASLVEFKLIPFIAALFKRNKVLNDTTGGSWNVTTLTTKEIGVLFYVSCWLRAKKLFFLSDVFKNKIIHSGHYYIKKDGALPVGPKQFLPLHYKKETLNLVHTKRHSYLKGKIISKQIGIKTDIHFLYVYES